MKRLARKLVRSLGFEIVPYPRSKGDVRFRDLSSEARHVVVAECGVWRGGSMMAMVLNLVARGDFSREIWLHDTFDGMSEPIPYDTRFDGQTAQWELEQTPRSTGAWCQAPFEEVERNIFSTSYPSEKIHFIKGKVDKTIPDSMPSRLSLLRLDTDWYESTKYELIHLFPLLEQGGILILDDYGHWQGARKAVDELFQERGKKPYLHRVDYTCRILLKGQV